LSALDPAKNGYTTGGRCINYIVSHDHDRLMQQLGDKGHMFGDVAFARVRLGVGPLATIPGIPMIWMLRPRRASTRGRSTGRCFGTSSPARAGWRDRD
jgi:hypothetical protein